MKREIPSTFHAYYVKDLKRVTRFSGMNSEYIQMSRKKKQKNEKIFFAWSWFCLFKYCVVKQPSYSMNIFVKRFSCVIYIGSVVYIEKMILYDAARLYMKYGRNNNVTNEWISPLYFIMQIGFSFTWSNLTNSIEIRSELDERCSIRTNFPLTFFYSIKKSFTKKQHANPFLYYFIFKFLKRSL